VSDSVDKLGTVVVKQYASGSENHEPELALIFTSCDAPTYGLRDAENNRYHWRQDLTRPATPEEAVRYWQQRAENAEHLFEKMNELNIKLSDHNDKLIERLYCLPVDTPK